jgi:hypothetical protein
VERTLPKVKIAAISAVFVLVFLAPQNPEPCGGMVAAFAGFTDQNLSISVDVARFSH